MGFPLTIHSKLREGFYSVFTLALLTALAGGLAVFASGSIKLRVLAKLLAFALCFAGAILSRNPRLYCLWGVGFSVPFMLAKTFGRVINKGGGEVAFNVDLTDIFLLILCIYLARDLFSGRRRYVRFPAASYFWIAIMFFGFYEIVAGPFRTTASHEVFRMVKMLVFFLVLCQELESPRRILHFCGSLTSGLIVNSIVALIQYYYHTTLGLEDLGEPAEKVTKTLAATSLNTVEIWRVGAFVIHPNIFGIFLASLLPLTVACFLLRKGLVFKFYFLFAFVSGTLALVATQSRSGWVSFAVALGSLLMVMIAHTKLRRRSTLAAAVIGIVLVSILVVERGAILRRIFDSREAATRFRGVFNDDAKRMIAEKPIWGFGLNTYVLYLPSYTTYYFGDWPPPVHQIYYLWCTETGVIGLLLHLATWGVVIWKGIRNLRIRNEQMFAVNAACLVGMLAFVLDGFVSFSPRLTPTLKTLWALSAIIMAIHYWRLRFEVYAPVPTADSRPLRAPGTDDRLVPALGPAHL